jgi:hypothetical protein
MERFSFHHNSLSSFPETSELSMDDLQVIFKICPSFLHKTEVLEHGGEIDPM